MNIYDCTTYFDEPLMMDVRFNVLNDYVKKFVVVESVFSHRGAKKELNFDIKLYPKFKDKIKYVVLEKEPDNLSFDNNKNDDLIKRLNSIKRIEHQRNEALKGCLEATEQDYIFYSDNDEIPKLNDINFNSIKERFIIFEQKLFHYKFNLFNDRIPWYGTKGAKKKNIKSIADLRNMKAKKYAFFRLDTLFSKTKFISVRVIKNGGWHFTQLKSPEDLEKKFIHDENHNEYDKLDIGLNKIKDMIDRKVIEYDHLAKKSSANKHGHEFKLKPVQIEKNLPDYLVTNVDKFKKWFDFDFK